MALCPKINISIQGNPKLERPFKIIALSLTVWVFSLFIIYASDKFAILGSLLNPHSEVGGITLLLIMFTALATSSALLIYLPKATILFLKSETSKTILNFSLLNFGLAVLFFIASWLFGFFTHELRL